MNELERVQAELKRVQALAETRLAKIWAYARAAQGRNPTTLRTALVDITRAQNPVAGPQNQAKLWAASHAKFYGR